MPPRLTFYAWLLVPVALLAYHFGPGQTNLQRDAAARQIAAAEKAEQHEDWAAAMQAYALALNQIPKQDAKRRNEVRLAHAKARMYSGEIVEATGDLKTLLAEMPGEDGDGAAQDEVRATLGVAEYYTGWLMRLEGATAAEWTPEVDTARQQFRLLSEDHLGSDEAGARGYQEQLEAAVRLARLDLSELRGVPLPKFCEGCKNVSQKCRGQCEAQGKKPAEKPKDARKAGTGERPRGGS
jgi:hypothetical protein